MISWITKKVAIGEYNDAVNEELLLTERVDCILNMRGGQNESSIVEQTIEMSLGINYFHLKVGSHQGIDPIKIELRTAIYMLGLLTKRYRRILVHCTSGIDRAPFVVAYWLASQSCKEMQKTGKGCRKCIEGTYHIIRQKRSQIMEHMEWI